jgi:toxin-antitoxin system PIN domain toxin
MIIPDINLLVYAYNTEDPSHAQAKRWWEELLNGTDPIGLPWVTISGFLRLVTHPRVLVDPMSVGQATEQVRAWLDCPSVLTVEPGKKFSAIFLGLLDEAGTAGNLTTDAYLAALAIEHQAELHSNDADFSRFKGLRWRNPMKA